MAAGVTIVEVKTEPVAAEQLPLMTGCYPTGKWIVVAEDALPKVFPPDMVAILKKTRRAVAGPEMFSRFLPDDLLPEYMASNLPPQ